MKTETRQKLKGLVQKVEYARGTTDFEKFTLHMLSFLDGLVNGLEESEPKKDKRWKPEDYQDYFTIGDAGAVFLKVWFNDNLDKFNFKRNYVFQTKELAQEHCDRINAIATVTDYIYNEDLQKNKVTWYSMTEQEKFAIVSCNQNLDWQQTTNLQYQSVIPYLKSPKACEQLIKHLPEELKLIFKN